MPHLTNSPTPSTGGAHAAIKGGPVLLTPSDSLNTAAQGYACGTGADPFVYGGTAAISDTVAPAFQDAINGTGC